LGLHEFLRRAAGAVAEDEVVLPGLILGRGRVTFTSWSCEASAVKSAFACVAADKISVLVFVQDEEVDVGVIVVRLDAQILYERFVVTALVGDGGVGGDFKRNLHRAADGERLMQNLLACVDRRAGDAIHGWQLFFFFGHFLLLACTGGVDKRGHEHDWQQPDLRLLIHDSTGFPYSVV
jgi:hypothetical protein